MDGGETMGNYEHPLVHWGRFAQRRREIRLILSTNLVFLLFGLYPSATSQEHPNLTLLGKEVEISNKLHNSYQYTIGCSIFQWFYVRKPLTNL
jgi:hypothetical protein